MKITKADKVKNQAKMTWFCSWNIVIFFSINFLSFSISTTKKCSNQNFMTLGVKTCWCWKPTHDDWVLHTNLPPLDQHFMILLATKTTKDENVENQAKMTWFCIETHP